MQYLVKWVGYPDSENQWVDKKDIHANQALKDFNKRNQDPPVRIRRTWVGRKASTPRTLMDADAPTSTIMATQETWS